MMNAWLLMLIPVIAATSCSRNPAPERCAQPGAVRCLDSARAEICDDARNIWVSSLCEEGAACVPDDANPELGNCLTQVCNPGERRCGDDNVLVYECDATGTSFVGCEDCSASPRNGMCFEGRCVSLCQTAQKSNIGCEYFAVDLDNAFVPCQLDSNGQLVFCDAQGGPFAVVVSNTSTEQPALVTVTQGPVPAPELVEEGCTSGLSVHPNVVAAVIVPPRGIEILSLPRRDVDGSVVDTLAYRIASNVPITAYQFNPLANVDVFSNDASLLLPTTAVGTDYWVMSRAQSFDNLRGFLTVVGIAAAPTQVSVTLTDRTLGGVGVPALQAGETFTTTLGAYEVLNIETDRIGADLTGSRIISDQPIVVFSGSEAANVPTDFLCDRTTGFCAYDQATPCVCSASDGPDCSPDAFCTDFLTCCADHLEQQLLPVESWGNEYVAVRSVPRGMERDVWRVLAAENGTQVTLEPPTAGPAIPTLNSGAFFEFESSDDFVLTSNQPVLLGQFLAAQFAPDPGRGGGDAGIGDPAFAIVPPARQWRETYVFVAPDRYSLDYVSLAVPVGGLAVLDGADAATTAGSTISVINSEFVAIRMPISDGFHTLTCSGGCGLMVHGYDNFVSYSYPGGLNLLDF